MITKNIWKIIVILNQHFIKSNPTNMAKIISNSNPIITLQFAKGKKHGQIQEEEIFPLLVPPHHHVQHI